MPRVAMIGTFDGVHAGHRAVLDAGAATRLRRTAITFDPHPRAFFGQPVPLLVSVERRVELLHEAGVEDVLVLPFTAAIAGLAPRDWIAQTLEPIDVRHVVVGRDFRFGRQRSGDSSTFASAGMSVTALELVPETSSTALRRLVATGQLEEAAALWGRPVELELNGARGVRHLDARQSRLWLDGRRFVAPPNGRYHVRLGVRPAILEVRHAGDGSGRVLAALRLTEIPGHGCLAPAARATDGVHYRVTFR